MNVLVILAHPDRGSFNHAIAVAACDALASRGHNFIFHDLYGERFDPLLPAEEIPKTGRVDPVVELHCTQLREADGLIFVHPNWWGQPPAVLKGWIDRVIRPGAAYEFLEGDSGEGVPAGLLKGKTALVFNTSNTPDEREKEVFGDPLESIWKRCIFDFCGIETCFRITYGVIVTSSPSQRSAWLRQTDEIVKKYFP